MVRCRECGKILPETYSTDICLDCSRKNIQKLFRDDPELKEAFKKTIGELRKPESIKKMADNTVRFMNAINMIRDRR